MTKSALFLNEALTCEQSARAARQHSYFVSERCFDSDAARRGEQIDRRKQPSVYVICISIRISLSFSSPSFLLSLSRSRSLDLSLTSLLALTLIYGPYHRRGSSFARASEHFGVLAPRTWRRYLSTRLNPSRRVASRRRMSNSSYSILSRYSSIPR